MNESARVDPMNDARRKVVMQLLKTAAWAPVAVLMVHAIVIRSPWHDELNHFIHFLGGAAIAFFFLRAVELSAETLHMKMPLGIAHAAAFTVACTAALFWEVGEFASDYLLHTQVQDNVVETMLDLIAGACGAGALLLGIAMKKMTRGE